MLPLSQLDSQQIPLIHHIHEDDIHLLNKQDCEWFTILYNFPWKDYREIAAQYYNALYDFNQSQGSINTKEPTDNPQESKEEAKQRLLFDRATMQACEGRIIPIIYEGKIVKIEEENIKINPESLSPGSVPKRHRGKKPKCFFGLLKAFIGITLMGFRSEPEDVFKILNSNPSFARVCGFFHKEKEDEYRSSHLPSLRKLEQFDQIMTEYGLWDKIKTDEVLKNIKNGVIKKENELVGDTTHYYAYSEFETIHYQDEKGKDKTKSQSKVTKKCGCADKNNCEHEWELRDDGAGTIVKSKNIMHWGHKASVIGLPLQGIPLDANAVSDAATNDGLTFFPHVEKLFKNYPMVQSWIDRVIYDSACDSKELKEKFKNEMDVELRASFNPRRKKEVIKNLPRGIEKITPYGIPYCMAGHELDYKGIRYEEQKFIYQAPQTNDGTSVCLSCKHRMNCCPNSVTTRTINISFDLLPHIDSNDPPMAKRFKAIMTRRPSVERMIKRLKCDLGDDRLSKRGNNSFQAYLDKSMIAFHILLRQT